MSKLQKPHRFDHNPAVTYCDAHGKYLYKSKSDAKRIAKEHRPRKGVYRCDHKPAYWHVGRLPRNVIQGRISRSQLVQREAA